MEDQQYTDDYVNLFDPEVYLKAYYTDVTGDASEGDALLNEMQFLHESFAGNNIKGCRLLDIGTGPTIHSVISASPHVDSIFLSDFAPQNRETLKQWLDGTLQHSFQNFFRQVVDLEGKGESPTDRENSLRAKISGILPIDLQQGYPLAPSLFPQFDVITSSLCMEAVAESLTNYEEIAGRIANMLNVGGSLVLFGVLGESFYKVGSHLFRCLKLDGEHVQNVWKKCGLKVGIWEQRSHTMQDTSASDFSGYFLMASKKVKS